MHSRTLIHHFRQRHKTLLLRIAPNPPLMATSSKLSSHLRRIRPSAFNYLATLSHARQFHILTNTNPKDHSRHSPPRNSHALAQSLAFSHSRFISTSSSDDSDIDQLGVSAVDQAATRSELLSLGCFSGEDSVLPVRVLISVLDGFHDLTGLPWWIVIGSSTLAMRISLLPLLIVQLQKLKRIGELFPKLPPPMPPLFSGKSYINQISLFRKERKAIGCPSMLWFLASFSVQVPCFLLWLNTIRTMSLGNHHGFDCGGALWFNNLTELPRGVLGSIFPFLIAGLHYANVQISFKNSSVGKSSGLLGTLANYYKRYLDVMTFPILFITYCVPQGSLVYWATNSSLSLIQQLALKDPALRAKLGLPDKDAPTVTPNPEEAGTPDISPLASPTKLKKINLQNLSPKELLNLSILAVSKGDKEGALLVLKLALEKDPEYVRALVVMGQTLLQKSLHAEAIEYFERAITKLLSAGQPTGGEDMDLLILASQWTGVAYVRQGKSAEGIVHLERVAQLEEPDEPSIKAHYFDGLLLLSSALSNEGRKPEAIKYLRLAAAYNPNYNELLEQYENENEEDGSFVSDLAGSRRRDY